MAELTPLNKQVEYSTRGQMSGNARFRFYYASPRSQNTWMYFVLLSVTEQQSRHLLAVTTPGAKNRPR